MTSDIAKRQRTVPSAKAFDFIWRRPVIAALQEGSYFDRFDEETGTLELGCFLRVDEDGFFLFWKSELNEGQVLELSQVSDVRQGTKPKDERLIISLSERGSTKSLEERIVTVCSGLDLVNISYTHFLASSSEIALLWIQALRSLTHNTKASNVCPMTQLRKHWLRLTLTVNPRGKIPVRVVTKTFASGRNERIIFQSLKELCLPCEKNDEFEPSEFTFEKFYELYHKICPRTDIEDLFNSLSSGMSFISAEKMIEFLNEIQRDPRLNEILYPHANKQTIAYILENYEPLDQKKCADGLSLECFYRYLMSDDNAPVFLDHLDIYQDMDQPLCHYYINSSHNTYLVGRQFGGKSSVEIYRQVLLSGCRCIELDCWDGKGEDQEPIITHGKAMCNDILFKDVIYAIRDTAFVTSDYPVIMSFENHCSKNQQYKLAKYCEEILGDLLLTKPLDRHPLEIGISLPSPEKLRRKILIKNKRLTAEVEKHQLDLYLKGQTDPVLEDNETVDELDSINCVEGELGPMNAFDPTVPAKLADIDAHPENKTRLASMNGNSILPTPPVKLSEAEMKRLVSKREEGNITAEEEQAMLAQYHYTGATTAIHPLLSSMVNYAQAVKFQGFDVAEENPHSFHVSSFNENVALGLIKRYCTEFVVYNKRQMSRIYPRGNRVDSSNYMPQIFWNAGCQMVALNFQTADLAMQLNQGKFEYNGNCGFLLKPEFMRRPERQFDPFSESPMDGVIAATCEVRIISGQFLSDRKVGTYVEVDMYGLPTDTIRKEFRTRVVPNNGLNPVYGDDAVFVFRKVVLPDLAVLRFAVYEDTGKLIGQRVLPLEGLQSGYRHISLRTEGNFPLSLPTLFCRVSLTTYVPEGLNDLVDALSDPRAFVSKEEQRMKQLASMGIDSSEIADVPATAKSSKRSMMPRASSSLYGASSVAGAGDRAQPATSSTSIANSSKKDEKKEDPKFPSLSMSVLRNDKSYKKLIKKQSKELELLRHKHEKEASAMLRTHTSLTDKLNAARTKATSLCKGTKSLSNGINSSTDALYKSEMSQLVHQQTAQWNELKSAQLKEFHELGLSFVDAQREILLKILRDIHEDQLTDLKHIQERENKEMKAQQTKISIESNRTVLNDQKLKNKFERVGRIRELNDYNTKRFIDQRKALAQKHERQISELRKRHEEEEAGVVASVNLKREELRHSFHEELLCRKQSIPI